MKKITSLIVILLMIMFQRPVHAQSELTHQAPTLQAGLNGLTFSRGTLDAQLIMEIVAEKQKEVGLKLVQNMFLSKMANSGGAFYSYTDNIIRGVVTEKDPEVISKKLLENTVNITFTYAFADYYVRSLKSGDENYKAFIKLAESNNIKCLGLTPKQTNNGLIGLRTQKDDATRKGKKNLQALDANSQKVYRDTGSVNLIALVVDMASEIIRTNQNLKDLGLLQVSYSQSYNYMNRYLQVKVGDNIQLYTMAKTVYADMETTLTKYTNVIGMVSHYVKSNTYRNNRTSVLNNFRVQTTFTANESIATAIETIADNVEDITETLTIKLANAQDTFTRQKLYADLKTAGDMYVYLKKAASHFKANPLDSAADKNAVKQIIANSDIIYTLGVDIAPKLLSMVTWDKTVLTTVNQLEDIALLIQDKYNASDNSILKQINESDRLHAFISIIGKLYEFDKASTFSNSLLLLSDLEYLFPNQRIKDALAFINTYTRDFVKIKKDNNNVEYLDFNVESFIEKMSDTKPENMRRMQGLFLVGVNTAYFNKPIDIPGDKIQNYSFVSEKIGLKFKLYDWSFWKTRNPGETYTIDGYEKRKITPPKEPVFSELHILVYGSGILYNLVNTGTSKDFHSPLVGTGLGVRFFNSLDMNAYIGIPILKKEPFYQYFNYSYVGLSFDFPFAEYIKRFNERQNDKRTQKLVTEALKND